MIGANARDACSGEQMRLADLGVAAHYQPLLLAERPFLAQQVLGHADLADVVQQRPVGDRLQLFAAQSDLHPDAGRVMGKPATVMHQADVLGLDGVGERGHDLRGAFEAGDRAPQPYRAAHPCQQLDLLHGLGQEVVGARIERRDHVVQRRVRGDDDDRQSRCHGVETQPAADLVAIDARQVQIEQHEVRRVLDDRAQADLAIAVAQ